MVRFYQSIKFKSILYITSVVLLIGMFSTALSYHFNKQQLKKTYIEKNLSVMEVTHNHLHTKCQNLYKLSLDIYSEQKLYQLLSQSEFDYSDFNYLKQLLQSYCSNDSDIHQIYLWCTNLRRSFLANTYTTFAIAAQTINPQLSVYSDRQIHSAPEKLSTNYDYEDLAKITFDTLPQKESVITFSRTLYPIHSQGANPLGHFSIDVKSSSFMDAAAFFFTSGDDDFYLLNDQDQILLSDTTVHALPLSDLLELTGEKDGFYEHSDGILIFQSTVSVGDLSLRIIKTAYPAVIYRTALQSFHASAFSLVVSWLLVLAIMLIIFGKLFQRISCLNTYIKRVKKGDLQASINDYPSLIKTDEIGILSKSFEESIESINHLTDQKYQLLLSNKEIQIKMLQAQINPHFINNALQAIGNAVFEKEPLYVYNLISNLGKMMKYSMHTDHNIIFLEEELDYLKQFLIFQAERIGDKFHFSIQTDPKSLECQIPKMLIQPLVENSVMHGYTGQKEAFYLSIETLLNDGYLEIVVTDNGSGVSPEHLEMLNQPLSYTKSIGIRNTYKRLSLFYNQDFQFHFENAAPHGLRGMIRIPSSIQGI
ncbi:MAG: histidine kinase [Lachnospiraceae bacterium]|nr:histidine kinase [Lachnospiraceae bacterium]